MLPIKSEHMQYLHSQNITVREFKPEMSQPRKVIHLPKLRMVRGRSSGIRITNVQIIKPPDPELIKQQEESKLRAQLQKEIVSRSRSCANKSYECFLPVVTGRQFADPDNCRRLGVDEQYIKFRPSPNFKNMKKFLKSKIDNNESSSQSPPNGSCEQTTPTAASESPRRNDQPMEAEEKPSAAKPIHPPLPLEPPPPDVLPRMPMPIIKSEVIDNEYQDEGTCQQSPNLSTEKTEEASPTLSVEQNGQDSGSTAIEKPKEICRDYIRGTCTRVACRYAHQREIIEPDELFKVYTFCKNFQNSICNRPQCKYVHASVFEQQEFYRTGILPPHIQPRNQPYNLAPPPPPPPLPVVEETRTPDAINAVGVQGTNITSKPLISCVPVSKLESQPAENDFRHILQEITSPLKNNWNPIDPFSPPAQHRNLDKQQCKKCDNSETRLQYNKEKYEKMQGVTKELKKKSQLLTMKSKYVFSTIITILRNGVANDNSRMKFKSIINTFGEKERELLQHIAENSAQLTNT